VVRLGRRRAESHRAFTGCADCHDNGRPIVRRIREEFVSGTRLGKLEVFRLSHEAAGRDATLTVRRAQTAPRQSVSFEFVDARTVRLLPEGTLPAPGSIYELHYDATNPRVQALDSLPRAI